MGDVFELAKCFNRRSENASHIGKTDSFDLKLSLCWGALDAAKNYYAADRNLGLPLRSPHLRGRLTHYVGSALA